MDSRHLVLTQTKALIRRIKLTDGATPALFIIRKLVPSALCFNFSMDGLSAFGIKTTGLHIISDHIDFMVVNSAFQFAFQHSATF